MRTKILASVVVTTLFSVSAVAQADNSTVTTASTDSLGLPSSALLLTDDESNNIRGTKYKAYKALGVEFDDLDCDSDLATDTPTTACVTLNRDVELAYEAWQEAKEQDMELGKSWTKKWRKNSY